MKIALFIAELQGGGAERMMVNLANALSSRGEEVYLICGRFEGPYCDDVSSLVNVLDLKERKSSRCIFKLYTHLQRIKPSCLITTQAHAIMTSVIACKLLPFKTRLIIREATTPSEAAARKNEGLLGRLRQNILKRLYGKADAYVSVSHGVKDDMLSFYKLQNKNIRVVPNPVITKDIDHKLEEIIDPPLRFVEEKSLKVIGVGRIHTVKDFSTLVRAFGIVRSKTPAHLTILGDREFNKQEYSKIRGIVAELKLEDCVEFRGFVKNPFAFLKQADVFVLSSLYEGMPGVIIQAMYCGCQIVSTDCKNGPSEILGGGKYGHLVAVGDYEAMAEKIIDINLKPVGQQLLRERALDFTDEKATNQYLDIIDSISCTNK